MTLPSTNITIDTPKKKAIALGVLLLTFLVGFAFGKFNNKPNVTIDQKTQTTTQATTQSQTDAVAQQNNQVQQNSNLNVNKVQDTDTTSTTTTDKKPTGEEITTTTTETKAHVDDSAQAKETTKDTSVDKEAKQVDTSGKTNTSTTTEFKETITQSQPKFMVGIFGGLDTSGLNLSGSALTTGPLLYGAEAGYRFLGPIWVDAKVMKTGAGVAVAAGLQLQF